MTASAVVTRVPANTETIHVFLPFLDDDRDNNDPLTDFCRASESDMRHATLAGHHSTHGLHVIRWSEEVRSVVVMMPLHGWRITVTPERRREFEILCRKKMWPYLIRLELADQESWAWYRQPETWIFAFDPCDGTMYPSSLDGLNPDGHVGNPPIGVALPNHRLFFWPDRIELLPSAGSTAYGLAYPVSPVALRRLCTNLSGQKKMIVLSDRWQPPRTTDMKLRVAPTTLVAFVRRSVPSSSSSSSSSSTLSVHHRPELKYFATMLLDPSVDEQMSRQLLERLNGLTGVPPMTLSTALRWLSDACGQS